MRRWLAGLLALVAVLGFLPAGAVPPAAGGALASDNVDLVANIPDAPVIGGRILGDYMYVTGWQGLRIYDVTAAGKVPGAGAALDGVPVLVGALELPHFENEDVDTNGDILVISADHLLRYLSILYVIDVRNKRLPVLLSATLLPSSYDTGHTATCINGCSYAWLTGGDTVYVADLRDPSKPTIGGGFAVPSWTHDVEVDSAGIAWVMDGAGVHGYTTADPLHPQPWASWNMDTRFIFHNGLRPNADKWAPRAPDDNSPPSYDRGEILLVGEEIWEPDYTDFCMGDDGDFFTASVIQHAGDAAPTVSLLDRFDLLEGDRPVTERKPAGGVCSTHYFSESNGVAAVAWYEQGVRFLDFSDPANITEIGYFMPAVTEVWATTWNKKADVVYAFDPARGLGVLKLNRAP